MQGEPLLGQASLAALTDATSETPIAAALTFIRGDRQLNPLLACNSFYEVVVDLLSRNLRMEALF